MGAIVESERKNNGKKTTKAEMPEVKRKRQVSQGRKMSRAAAIRINAVSQELIIAGFSAANGFKLH